MLFSTLQNIEKCPFTYWLNRKWFLQIVDRDSWNLYPIFPCSDFVSQMWEWLGGGGVMFLSYFYAIYIYDISRTNILGQFFFEKNNYFLFNVFFMFFYVGNIENCPFTYLLSERWVLQIVDIHVVKFNMKLTRRWFPQIVDRDSGNLCILWC